MSWMGTSETDLTVPAERMMSAFVFRLSAHAADAPYADYTESEA